TYEPFGAGDVLRVGFTMGLTYFALWALVFVLPVVVEDARVRALEADKLRTQAELAQLRSHLEPHFLLNTLNAIAGLVTEDARLRWPNHRAHAVGRSEGRLHHRGQRARRAERRDAAGRLRPGVGAAPACAAVFGRSHAAAGVFSGRYAVGRRASARGRRRVVNLLKALVLEDEWPTRNYLVKLLEDTHRAEVVGAIASLDEAREAMAGSPVDVVFVD